MNQRGIIVGDRLISNVDTHADWCAAFGSCQQYDIVGASAIGHLHVHQQLSRDDAFLIRTADEWIAVAVADGVGSRRSSRYGATYAVGALCEFLLRAIQGESNAGSSVVAAQPTVTTTREEASPDRQDDVKPSVVAAQPTSMTPREVIQYLRRFIFTKVAAQPTSMTPREETDKCRDNKYNLLAQPILKTPQSIDSHSDEEDSSDTLELSRVTCGTLTWLQPSQRTTSETSAEVTDEKIRWAFRETRRGLEQFARSRQVAIHDISCTLLGLLFNTRTGLIAVGQIGDGLIVGSWRGEDTQILVDAPQPDAVGEVYTIAHNRWENYLAVKVISQHNTDPVEALYLMTDGVADDCFPPVDLLKKWSCAVTSHLRNQKPFQAAKSLVHWLGTYKTKASWDDRTLVVILRRFDKQS
jgi:serine/threonine protein phosphatase PrpC